MTDIGELERLEHFNAQQTNIANLPAEIAFCQNLEELLLWGNAMESLPDTMKVCAVTRDHPFTPPGSSFKALVIFNTLA